MPQLVKLQADLKDSGFAIIGAHAQQGTEDEIRNVLRQYKVNYTATSSADVPGHQVSGLPTAFLFDTGGKLVETDHHVSPQKVRDLVKTEPHFLAAGRTYTRHRATAEMLKTAKAYGPILKKLEKDLKGDGAAAEEAKYLDARIRAHGKKQIEEAKSLEESDAFLATQAYTNIVAAWKGEEPGDQAAARLKELKGDKPFQEELKAATVAHQILAECSKLIAQGGKINLEYGLNQKTAANVRASVTALKKKFPEAKATAMVLKDIESYGFKGL